MTAARGVHELLWELLDTTPGVATYDGEVPKNPPADNDGRVYGYAVLYDSPGRRHANALDGEQRSADRNFQVTCAGGDPNRVLWCVDRVTAQLVGSSVNVDGTARRIRLREDADPGTVRRDDDVKPPRHFVPLRFQLLMP